MNTSRNQQVANDRQANNQVRSCDVRVPGGSFAGFLTAHVLADHFDRVTLIERDDFAQVSSRTIFRWAKSGAVHSSETPEGLPLIRPYSPN